MSGRELQLVKEVFDSNWIAPVGPHLDLFEKQFAEYIGVKHALAVSSGTAALHLALRNLDLQPDDEVLCSTLTFCASANPIVYERAKPVFIDSDAGSWNLDPNLLKEELTACAKRGKLPRAVVAVDIFGQSADMATLTTIAAQYDIPVIEDAAESLGSTYLGRSVGVAGWASFFSFNGNKIITCSGGGMLCSDDESLIKQSRFLATQARDPAPHYQHSAIGHNYRMSNVLAGIGLGQLAVLNEYVQARRLNFQLYRELLEDLPGITFMPEISQGRSNRWLTVIQIDAQTFGASPEEVRLELERNNIESRPVWKPLHMQPLFSDCRSRGGTVAANIFRNGLCLPSGSSMEKKDLHRVAMAIRAIAERRHSSRDMKSAA